MKGCNQLRAEPGPSLILELPPKSSSWWKKLLQQRWVYWELHFSHGCLLFRSNACKMLQAFQTLPNKSWSKELPVYISAIIHTTFSTNRCILTQQQVAYSFYSHNMVYYSSATKVPIKYSVNTLSSISLRLFRNPDDLQTNSATHLSQATQGKKT